MDRAALKEALIDHLVECFEEEGLGYGKYNGDYLGEADMKDAAERISGELLDIIEEHEEDDLSFLERHDLSDEDFGDADEN